MSTIGFLSRIFRLETGVSWSAGSPTFPEIPVSNLEKAADYYVNALGIHFNWSNDKDGIGNISQGDCRLFLKNAAFRQGQGDGGPFVVWLNLDSKQEV